MTDDEILAAWARIRSEGGDVVTLVRYFCAAIDNTRSCDDCARAYFQWSVAPVEDDKKK